MYNFSILRDLKKMLLLINCCNKRGNHAISQNWCYFRSRKVFFYTLLNQCDWTMEKIRVNRSSTQEELWKYRKCSLFNDERETTRAKFWRAKTSIACLDSRNDFKLIRCFCCCFFSVKFLESCGMTDNC
jgi:hypothetical protein